MGTIYVMSEVLKKDKVVIRECSDDLADLHSHSFFEFVYVLSGRAEHTIDGRSMILSKGDYFFIDLKSTHAYRKITDDEDFKIINCLFLPSFIDSSLEKAAGLGEIIDNSLVKFASSAASSSVTAGSYHDADGFVGRVINQMLFEYAKKQKGYKDVIRNLLMCVLIYLLRNDTGLDAGSKSITSYIKEYISENYMHELRLSDISKKLNFSLTYVSLMFKRDTHMSFRDYLAKVRMERACNLLRVSKKTVSEIAGHVGYVDDTFFYKSFKKYLGVTPIEYRKKWGETGE